MIPESQIEEIIEKNEIADVVSEYTKLTRKGSGYMGLCPFHRKKLLLFQYTRGSRYLNVLVAEKVGNVVHFIMLGRRV